MEDMIKRRFTKAVNVGSLTIGGNAPVLIQTMTNSNTADVQATLNQIREIAEAGCDLVRVAVPDRSALSALATITKKSPVPVIADIHYDIELALESIYAGASKIRINPGNIGKNDKLKALALLARERNVPIRIGVNAGSLEKQVLAKYGRATGEALVESALAHVRQFERMDFNNLVVSLKASTVYTTILANRLMAAQTDYPIHLGVTEAGPLQAGTIKGSIGIGTLLADGIGDTIRVSLTADPTEEVRVAAMILQSLNLGKRGPELISCPTCGRCQTDLISLVNKVEDYLKSCRLQLKVAVMGCSVNGPGEAKEADIGISAGKKRGLLFKKGTIIATVDNKDLFSTLLRELESYASEVPGDQV